MLHARLRQRGRIERQCPAEPVLLARLESGRFQGAAVENDPLRSHHARELPKTSSDVPRMIESVETPNGVDFVIADRQRRQVARAKLDLIGDSLPFGALAPESKTMLERI